MAYYRREWIPMTRFAEPQTNSQDFSYKPQVSSQTLGVSPDEDNEDVPAYRKQTFRQRYFGGVKRTLRTFTVVASVILIINVVWLLYAKAKYGIKDGYGTIQKGSCDEVKRTNTWMHLAINILSTLLLTGSNAFMAAYSGPTREEVDEAHSRRKWLHIGSMSFRNMRGIAKRKTLVVLVLALSSIPFHLLYNSLVFTQLAANSYYWTIATSDFVTGSPFDLGDASMSPYFDEIQKSAPSWQHLDQKECINAYANVFVSSRRNVVLISKTKNNTNSVLDWGLSEIVAWGSALDSNWWICSELSQDGPSMTCNPRSYLANATSWNVFGYDVDYCLSEPVDDICSLQFSQDVMLVVVAFNALKLVAMIWVLLRFDAERILTSVGDAAASFMMSTDLTTAGMCLANKRQINTFWATPGASRPYNDRSRGRWGQAVSRKRWILFFLLMGFAFFTVFIFGLWGFAHVKDGGINLDFSSLWELGFGTLDQHTMVFVEKSQHFSAISMSLLANTPQAILALIYLMYMGIMAAMFIAADWANFGVKSQTLMVATAAGEQRGTWLLSAPLGYGIGLVALQALLHWFVSQSIFVVQVSVFDANGNLSTDLPLFSNCGYSPIAILLSVIAAGLLCITALVGNYKRFPKGAPPVVSTCSAAISAACHVPTSMCGKELVYSKLRWGMSGQGHCSLVPAEEFKAPVGGWMYAGQIIE